MVGAGRTSGMVGLMGSILVPVAPLTVDLESMTSLGRVVGPWMGSTRGICLPGHLVGLYQDIIRGISSVLGRLLFAGLILQILCSRGNRLTG